MVFFVVIAVVIVVVVWGVNPFAGVVTATIFALWFGWAVLRARQDVMAAAGRGSASNVDDARWDPNTRIHRAYVPINDNGGVTIRVTIPPDGSQHQVAWRFDPGVETAFGSMRVHLDMLVEGAICQVEDRLGLPLTFAHSKDHPFVPEVELDPPAS